MAQTHNGAILLHCRRLGMSLTEYRQNQNLGLKWCTACKEWHNKDDFTRDVTRWDELSAKCLKAQREFVRTKPKRIRDRTKERARGLVNAWVVRGKLTNPNDLPCTDCGHIGDAMRHEYDHVDGYEGKAKTIVQAVCTICHAKREITRRSNGR